MLKKNFDKIDLVNYNYFPFPETNFYFII